jgi:DNA-binding MarR family transcriptional regulator/GNAT superfamily N-acetyltransferase
MEPVARVRSFNRTVTRQIGALDDHFLGRDRSLGASRLLFEIGSHDGIELRALRTRLGLDSGYASRLLRSLEREKLIRIERSPSDARVSRVHLTPAGREELADLNRLSDAAAAATLEPLSESQREALISAMATVERLLTAGTVQLEVADPVSPSAIYCLNRYYSELAKRFEDGYDPTRGIGASAEELTPPRGYFVIARLNGQAIGCGVIKCHRDSGEIKRMWVDPNARGLGVGRRILERLEAIARERGLPMLRLETNRTLKEAQSLYRSAGFEEVPAFNHEPYADHWFAKRL